MYLPPDETFPPRILAQEPDQLSEPTSGVGHSELLSEEAEEFLNSQTDRVYYVERML